MRHVPSDKYNVAWFKLAECVSRGEKERALGVYRLLAHSFDNPAFATQLEGDILLAFNDQKNAIEKYHYAAQLYAKNDCPLEAAAVYEHLMVLVGDKQECITQLIDLYHALGITAKKVVYLQMKFALLLGSNKLEQAAHVIDQLEKTLVGKDFNLLQQELSIALLKSDIVSDIIVTQHVLKTVDGLIQNGDSKALQRFLMQVEGTNQKVHQKICDYLKEKDQD